MLNIHSRDLPDKIKINILEFFFNSVPLTISSYDIHISKLFPTREVKQFDEKKDTIIIRFPSGSHKTKLDIFLNCIEIQQGKYEESENLKSF